MRLLVSQLGLALLAIGMVVVLGAQWLRARTLPDVYARRRATAAASFTAVMILIGVTLLVLAGKL
jgi:multisubunit Na+/H+ antiporter MnhG subunit